MPNRVKLIMSSNKEWVVPATADERRFFVLDVPDTYVGDRPYWRRYWAAVNNKRTLGAYLEFLLERDLSEFEVRDVPSTAALDDQKVHSFEGPERWLCSFLDRGVSVESFTNTYPGGVEWKEEIPFDSLVDCYDQYCRSRQNARYALHRETLGRFLSKYYEKVRQPRPKDGSPRGWNYVFGALEFARARFCEVQKVSIEWHGRS
jgi:hypothetical protein